MNKIVNNWREEKLRYVRVLYILYVACDVSLAIPLQTMTHDVAHHVKIYAWLVYKVADACV